MSLFGIVLKISAKELAMSNFPFVRTAAVAVGLLMLAGCNATQRGAAVGAGVGATAGAIVTGSARGAAVGAAAGGLAGALSGRATEYG